MSQRFFTVAEVNALLPDLESAVRSMRESSARLEFMSRQIFKEDRPLPDTPVERAYLVGLEAVMASAEQIDSLGGEVKDLATGLVDFPSLREGRQVLLCWQLGEQTVGFWHEPEAGFAGRSAINDATEFKSGGAATGPGKD